uniref:Uncharacterized protein n=1 Tax=Arundo donax TaxID=35708 RepID=A0A0A9AER5_ARUDO
MLTVVVAERKSLSEPRDDVGPWDGMRPGVVLVDGAHLHDARVPAAVSRASFSSSSCRLFSTDGVSLRHDDYDLGEFSTDDDDDADLRCRVRDLSVPMFFRGPSTRQGGSLRSCATPIVASMCPRRSPATAACGSTDDSS